jgi:hypothetical protein
MGRRTTERTRLTSIPVLAVQTKGEKIPVGIKGDTRRREGVGGEAQEQKRGGGQRGGEHGERCVSMCEWQQGKEGFGEENEVVGKGKE